MELTKKTAPRAILHSYAHLGMSERDTKTKLCVACGHEWDVAAFYTNRHSADGLQAYCRSCQGIYNARNPKAGRKAARKPFNSAPEKKRVKSPRAEAFLSHLESSEPVQLSFPLQAPPDNKTVKKELAKIASRLAELVGGAK